MVKVLNICNWSPRKQKERQWSEVILEDILVDNFHKSMGHQSTDADVLWKNAEKTILRHTKIN